MVVQAIHNMGVKTLPLSIQYNNSDMKVNMKNTAVKNLAIVRLFVTY